VDSKLPVGISIFPFKDIVGSNKPPCRGFFDAFSMSHLVTQEQMEAFANYAEKHDIFEMFKDAVSNLVISKPSDPYQYLIDYFAKPRGKAIILFSPPGSGLSTAVCISSFRLTCS
jgi:hypothetical protein